MNTRRDFIKYLAMAGAALAVRADAFGKVRSASRLRFANQLREQTQRLHVVPGR